MRPLMTALIACAAGLGGCASAPVAESAEPVELREVFPGVRVDVAAGVVEFDGEVAVDVHDPETPDVYLELVVTGPDSREHESLVVTDARPSHIHAAMLLAGAEAGSPGLWRMNGGEVVRIAPTGSQVRVEIHAGDEELVRPEAWMRKENGSPAEIGAFVFAGSRWIEYQGDEYYDADGTGTIVGLATFGSEVIAAERVLSHESMIDAPVYLADNAAVPAVGTPVVVRLTILKDTD